MSIDYSRMQGPGAGRGAQIAAASSAQAKPPIQFFRGVVEEVIFDANSFDWDGPEGATEDDQNRFTDKLEFPELRHAIPDNTLLVRVITAGEYKQVGKLKICYPLLPSHLQMPIKVAEQVFFLQEGKIGYWLARAPGSLGTDDANYSHNDRQFITALGWDSVIDDVDATESGSEISIGTFNNGAAAEDMLTFSHDDDYDVIWENSQSVNASVPEPVPKFVKRPGDLVLQGSNNTLICLGQNRGWKKIDELALDTPSNAHFTEEEAGSLGVGSIDVVVGRSRYMPLKETTEGTAGEDPIRTACRTVANERELIEADRVPHVRTLENNMVEGDPDFGYDAARILLTMKSNSDDSFNILGEGDGLPSVPEVAAGGDGAVPAAIEEAAYAVIKSDEIRLIARFQEEAEASLPEAPAINGSIKIIKEGVQDSEAGDGRAVIMLMPDGTIMIDGPTVVIGSGASDLEKANAEGTQIVLGRGATEPLVLGQILHDLLDKHFDDLKTEMGDLKTFLQSGYDAHVHPTGVGPSGPPVVPAIAHETAITQFETAIDASKNDLINTLSKYGKLK